jgi:hypothetical protein
MAGILIDEHNLEGTKIMEIEQKIICKFLLNSKCATEVKEKRFLQKLLKLKQLDTNILYRGSDHGWTFKDFHDRCDKKGPKICLFRVKDGDCIGGYTAA